MRKLIYFFLITSPYIFYQCSNEVPTSSVPINLELGKVSLKIDKSNAPEEIVLVEAFLIREGYDTLHAALNILSSTSAEITFEDVSAGNWYLKVDAKDSLGVILYTGETAINILAGILTQINLTLIPSGYGTGNIYILVNWGTTTNWMDYHQNPIFTKSNSYNNPNAVVQAKIIKENNVFKMWYTNLYNSAITDVWYAESYDGINWTSFNHAVLERGEYGSWDSYSVQGSTILKVDSSYLMYYTGMTDQYDYWNIGLAFSNDGINWIKHPVPVLLANFNEPQIHVDCVIKVDNIFYMYYSILNDSYRSIGMATSTDGINWMRNQTNPILTSTQNWEGTLGVYFPSVIYESNIFKMVYMNQLANSFGMATSYDGINWTKSNSNPLFTKEDTHNNWVSRISYPYIFKIDNEYRLYYTGDYSYGSNAGIGFVQKFGSF